jgi:hypothetical protein
MSHRKHIFKKGSARSSQSPLKSDLVPIDYAPKIRRPYGAPDAVVGPSGRLYAPGGPFVQLRDPGRRRSTLQPEDVFEPLSTEDGEISDVTGNLGVCERAPSKKEKQWNKWNHEVIPAMLGPYLRLLRETESLRNMSAVRREHLCSGCPGFRNMEISCVYFDSVFSILHLTPRLC